jgi:hypothetical protein
MVTNPESINSIRTKLLISINEELTLLKKNCTTKIQSRKLNEFEDLFYSSYDIIIKLKEESFIPQNYTREVVQEKKAISKFLLESPDNNKLNFYNKKIQSSKEIQLMQSNLYNKNNNIKDIQENDTFHLSKIFEKKSISTKKNNYFKTKLKDEIFKGKNN